MRPPLFLFLFLCLLPLRVEAQAADPLRRLFDGIRGANAVQCEMAVGSVGNWYGWRQVSPDRDPQAGAVIAWVDRRHRDPALVPPLAAALKDPDTCVRRMAARLLGRIRVPAARARLLEALGDREAETRRLAAIGLGIFSDKSTTPALVRALNDRDPMVRAAVAWALGAVD